MTKFNTDSIDSVQFRPHGRIEWAPLEEGIIVYKAYGPFNAELFDALITLESEDFENLQNTWSKWVEVVLFVDSCFVMGDAIAKYKAFLKEAADSGAAPMASAFIYTPGLEGGSFSNKSYREVYDHAGIDYEEFDNFDDALIWAKNKLNTPS